MSNKDDVLKELDELIKYYDDEYYSFRQDAEPKYQSYCNKVAHLGTMLEYLKNVLTGETTDFQYVEKYTDELENYAAFECYSYEFVEKLRKELEWTQQQ